MAIFGFASVAPPAEIRLGLRLLHRQRSCPSGPRLPCGAILIIKMYTMIMDDIIDTYTGWWFFATPLKNMSSSFGMMKATQYIQKKNGNQTTNQMI